MDLTSAVWRKSTRSGNNGGNCVEIAAPTSSLIGVRDSKNPDGGHLLLARDAWVALTNSIKDGRHDL